MDANIRDKVIVVTRAGRGLGRALAIGLAGEGARVAVLARHEQQSVDTVPAITARFPDAPKPFPVVADVTDETQVRDAAAAIDAHWGRIDALINNAGRLPAAGMNVLDIDASTLRDMLDINLVSGFLTTKHVAPIMIRGGGGRIIYISSMIGVQANPGQSIYGAAKAGVNILANVVHRELADQGLRTVALAPGLTDTPGMRAATSDEYIDRVAATYPGGRLGQPEDIVPFAAFLCSDAASHLSGTLLPIRPVTG